MPDKSTYAVDVLTTARGLVKGVWATFEPLEWLDDIPTEPGRKETGPDILCRLLIGFMDLEKIARDRADIEGYTPRKVGEGSFGSVWRLDEWPGVVAKVMDKPALERVELEASRLALEASRRNLGPRVFGTGWLRQKLGRSRRSMVIVMESLDLTPPAGESAWAPQLLREARLISRWAFHNDLQAGNIMMSRSRPAYPVVIDFDLAHEWRIKVAVTSTCIEFNSKPLFDELGVEASEQLLPLWREYYDLVVLTCSIGGSHGLYTAVLDRLVQLFSELREPVLEVLFTTVRFISEEQRLEVPFEVCVREPTIEGVTIHLADLAGNAFAHGRKEWKSLPSLVRSNGVYWPKA